MDLHTERYLFVSGDVDGADVDILVDSGAGISLIDSTFARRLGLRGQGSIGAKGVGGTTRAELMAVSIGVGPFDLRDVVVAALDLGPISEALGRETLLILGPELFHRAVVDLDYPNRRLALHDPEEFAYHGTGATVELRQGESGTMLVPARVEGLSTAWFSLDTGSGHTVDCFRPYRDRHRLLQGRSPVSTHYASGVGGSVRARVATLRSFHFASYELKTVPAYFPESRGNGWGSGSTAGNLGAGILTRFRVILDYGGAVAHVEPGPAHDSRPFRKDRLGIVPAVSEGKLWVGFVAPGSPAARGGWKIGDRIIAVNGVPGSPAVMKAELERLRVDPEGTSVMVTDGRGTNRQLILATYY